jgi:hypothetical protein
MIVMLAAFAAFIAFGTPAVQTPAKMELHDPARLKADFNAAKGVPRVVIILSPS